LNAVFDTSLDGISALSEASEVSYVTSVYAKLFPGWKKLQYKDTLYVIRCFYSKYVSNVDALIDTIAGVDWYRVFLDTEIGESRLSRSP
jgi:hypothetical protein